MTFDDAHRSVLELAYPILERLGLPGTVFVPTAYATARRPLDWPGIDKWLGGPHERELECMSWDELRWLCDAGWEIGSHTCTHPRLTKVDGATLRAELVDSRVACEAELGAPCRSLAYPYSDYDARVVSAAREAGYSVAAIVAMPSRIPLPLQWPRVGIYNDTADWRFRVRVSPTVRVVRRTALWRAADRVRHCVWARA